MRKIPLPTLRGVLQTAHHLLDTVLDHDEGVVELDGQLQVPVHHTPDVRQLALSEQERKKCRPFVKVRANRRFIFVQVSSFIDSNTIQAYFDN